MLMKVLELVFLFIIRLRLPRSQSIADVIRKRYGDKALKNVRKFERLDCQVRKCQLDIEFLNTCHKYNVIPNFLRFHVTNKTLKDSLTYSRCQQLLLIFVGIYSYRFKSKITLRSTKAVKLYH